MVYQKCLFAHILWVVLCVLQDSAQEAVITRDIHRTFPAHDYFKDTDGDGQDSLYKICKVTKVPLSFAWQIYTTLPIKSEDLLL